MGLLTQYFLRSFFESDLIARGGDARSLTISLAALFAAPGLMLCMYYSLFEGANTTPMLAFFVALGMVLIGLVAVLEWDELYPSRTDLMVLGPLPLSAGTILGAKAAALGALAAGFAGIVNLFSASMLPLLAGPVASSFAHRLRLAAAQTAATGAASLWLFLVIVAVQGLALALGGANGLRRFGPSLQMALMVLLLAGLMLSPSLTSPSVFARMVASHSRLAAPLLWFVGLDKWVAGGASAVWNGLGRTALWVLSGTTVATAALYGLSFRRLRREALVAPTISGGRIRSAARGWWRGIERLFLRAPRQRAVYRFAVATMTRSRIHRLYLAGWLGFGVAVVVESGVTLAWRGSRASWGEVQVAALAVPFALCFFLLVGLRHVFTIPVEWRANWIFRLSETGSQPERLGAAAKVMVVYAAAPVLLLSFPVSVLFWGWRHAGLHLAFAAGWAALLIMLLLGRFRKLPFTCSYLPDKANLRLLWGMGVLAFVIFVSLAPALEYRLWIWPEGMIGFLLLIGAVLAGLVWEHRHWRADLPGCQFDDEPEALVQSLFNRD